MGRLTKSLAVLSLAVVVFIAACSAPASQNTPTQPATEQTLYADPFAYCAAVGTVDAPDARYNGPEMPDSVIQGLIQQGVISADAPAEFQKSAVWRCMDGQVWACHFGANLPCLEKADTSQTPTSEMESFCATNPTAEGIPAAVTGRATVYEWKCTDGKPEVGQQLFHVDAQGFLGDFWYELTPLTGSRRIFIPAGEEPPADSSLHVSFRLH
ncbi:MAG TPA: hypothetical protein PKL16_10655 [Anaerolineae bacterium]|nr:hypothetical protein [Anaerolineae bacterium]HQM14871.1 hypothetical protein [Anaerolineae bacterium]